MKTVSDLLTRAHEELGQLETALREVVVNQNISDILASARAKLAQAASHPDAVTDLDMLKPVADPAAPRFPFDVGGDKKD